MGNPPIQQEIKRTSGFETVADLKDAMPKDPDAAFAEAFGEVPKKTTKKTAASKTAAPAAAPNPFADDKRYQEACGRMSALGGKGMIIRGFDAGAKALDDETFKLNAEEKLVWDDFFYVLSKKPFFDVGSPVYLAIFFVVMLFAQLGWRVLERTESEFLSNLFNKPKAEAEAAGAKK